MYDMMKAMMFLVKNLLKPRSLMLDCKLRMTNFLIIIKFIWRTFVWWWL